MNIFVLNENPRTAAQNHCDKHVVKMIMESIQIDSTNLRLCNGFKTKLWDPKKNKLIDWYQLPSDTIKRIADQNGIYRDTLIDYKVYRPTHTNHPCTKWARESKQNRDWLVTLIHDLHSEWQYRFNHTRNHKSYDMWLNHINGTHLNDLPFDELTPFAQAMPEEYQNNDAVEAYREYYKNDKAHLLTYTKRAKPIWL